MKSALLLSKTEMNFSDARKEMEKAVRTLFIQIITSNLKIFLLMNEIQSVRIFYDLSATHLELHFFNIGFPYIGKDRKSMELGEQLCGSCMPKYRTCTLFPYTGRSI